MRTSPRDSEFSIEDQSFWHAECNTSHPTARRPPRQLNEHMPVVRRLITCPFVILSKLSPRYGDHARHGILHVSHNQGDEVPWPSGTGTTLGETLVRLGSPDVSSRRCIADSRHPPVSRMMLCIEPRPSLRSEDPVGIPSQGQPGPYFLPNKDYPDVIRRNSQSPNRGDN